MFKCSNVQMFKCSNVQIFKCLNVKFQISNVNKVRILSELTSEVPPVIFDNCLSANSRNSTKAMNKHRCFQQFYHRHVTTYLSIYAKSYDILNDNVMIINSISYARKYHLKFKFELWRSFCIFVGLTNIKMVQSGSV